MKTLRVMLAVFLTLCVAAPASAATLHAIFVIDTDDKNIGQMVARDLGIVGDEIQRIAQATGLTLSDRVYKGRDFTIDNVRNAVNSVAPGPDDVVFFYYSGHGFRTPPKKSDWPYFFFHSDRAIDFGWVADTLRGKGARLAISLVDACNNVVNVQVREEQKGMPASASKAAAGYKELFLRYRGYVTGASSIPGETSTATGSGSLFTLSFLKAMRREISRAQPSWKSLMDNAAGSRLTRQSSSGQAMSQQPFYAMQATRVAVATPPTPRLQIPPQPPAPTVQFPGATQPPAAQPPRPQPPVAQPPQ
ncbi:MAG: caspase family protein, partial [Alphaproteobacteria bacterium]|nr:caspase family protein [Alphaproteobacteria bacterium]